MHKFEDPCGKLQGIFYSKELSLILDPLAHPEAQATGNALAFAVQTRRNGFSFRPTDSAFGL